MPRHVQACRRQEPAWLASIPAAATSARLSWWPGQGSRRARWGNPFEVRPHMRQAGRAEKASLGDWRRFAHSAPTMPQLVGGLAIMTAACAVSYTRFCDQGVIAPEAAAAFRASGLGVAPWHRHR